MIYKPSSVIFSTNNSPIPRCPVEKRRAWRAQRTAHAALGAAAAVKVHLLPRDGRPGGALPYHVPRLRGWLGRRRVHRSPSAAEVWSLGCEFGALGEELL